MCRGVSHKRVLVAVRWLVVSSSIAPLRVYDSGVLT